jgi:uncharacterized protein YlaI
MSRYYCNFPSCSYSTDDRNKIDLHHIQPRETGGADDKWNRVWLCPNCHRNIYIPTSKRGMHSKKSTESIELLGIQYSTAGYFLEYKTAEDEVELQPLKF